MRETECTQDRLFCAWCGAERCHATDTYPLSAALSYFV